MSTFSSRVARTFATVGVTVAVVALTACAGTTSADSGSDTGLDTVTAGKFTVATGEPSYFPWVIDDAPESGEGFEAAVAYAVAAELGYDEADVVWVRTTFDSAIAPGPKDFDVNLQQFTITEDRTKAIDFSSAYYTTTQAVVALAGSKADGADSIAALKDVVLGVASGTTSYTVVQEQVGVEPQVFNSNEDAVLALTSGQIDAIVVDLPTAFYLAGVQLDGGLIVGQFNDSTGGDDFAFLLAKDSSLTSAVTAAVDALRADGTLDALAEKWLSSSVDVPVLR
jgi:polar amino acid transport system substrate-binding protein